MNNRASPLSLRYDYGYKKDLSMDTSKLPEDVAITANTQGGEMNLETHYTMLPQSVMAKFEEGKSVDVPKYLEEHGNPEAAKEWIEQNEAHKDQFKTAGIPPREGSHGNKMAGVLQAIRAGDRVTITTPHGQQVTGRAVMKGPAGWVLNLGGPHGRPGIATEENTVKVVPAKRASTKEASQDNEFLRDFLSNGMGQGSPEDAVRYLTKEGFSPKFASELVAMWNKERPDLKPDGQERTARLVDYVARKTNTHLASRSYIIGVAHNGDPIVDGHFDPILFCMILSKVLGAKVKPTDPSKVVLTGEAPAVSVGGILTTAKKALIAARQQEPSLFKPAAGGFYRIDIAVGSIYEKGASLEGTASDKVAVGDIPADVERYVKEVKESNPDYDEAQVWATAWSIYCKHKNPGSDHCQMPTSDYFKAASDLEAAWGNTMAKGATVADWEEGHIIYPAVSGPGTASEDDFGSDVPDGSGNIGKRAAEEDDSDDGVMAKFEKGKPADPTKNMSPEDAAEWKEQNEEHADQFKSARQRLSWQVKAATKVASDGATTKAFLGKIDPKTRAEILNNIAKHYGISAKEAEKEVTDPEAGHLLDYLTGPIRAATSLLMKRHSIASKQASLPTTVQGWLEWEA